MPRPNGIIWMHLFSYLSQALSSRRQGNTGSATRSRRREKESDARKDHRVFAASSSSLPHSAAGVSAASTDRVASCSSSCLPSLSLLASCVSGWAADCCRVSAGLEPAFLAMDMIWSPGTITIPVLTGSSPGERATRQKKRVVPIIKKQGTDSAYTSKHRRFSNQ